MSSSLDKINFRFTGDSVPEAVEFCDHFFSLEVVDDVMYNNGAMHIAFVDQPLIVVKCLYEDYQTFVRVLHGKWPEDESEVKDVKPLFLIQLANEADDASNVANFLLEKDKRWWFKCYSDVCSYYPGVEKRYLTFIDIEDMGVTIECNPSPKKGYVSFTISLRESVPWLMTIEVFEQRPVP